MWETGGNKIEGKPIQECIIKLSIFERGPAVLSHFKIFYRIVKGESYKSIEGMNRRSFYILTFKPHYLSVAWWDTNSPTFLSLFCLTARRTSFSKQKVEVWVINCVQLFVMPETAAGQAPLSMWILQASILEWVAIHSLFQGIFPRDQIWVSCIARRFFTIWATGKASEIIWDGGKGYKTNLNWCTFVMKEDKTCKEEKISIRWQLLELKVGIFNIYCLQFLVLVRSEANRKHP